jgi:hypothetical protein
MKTIHLLVASVLFTVGCVEPSDPTEIVDEGSIEAGIPPEPAASDCKWSDTTCCDEKLYTDLGLKALKRYMVNYRNHVWSKTSPYFEDPAHSYSSHWNTLCDPSTLDSITDRFDARYLDVTIGQLENYLCRIKSMGVCEGSKKPDMLRIYYLRYDSKDHPDAGEVPKNYHDSHTLGFTPLLSTDKWNEACYGQQGQYPIWIPEPDAESPMANHNQICPPLTCFHLESMIKITDCKPGIP